MRRWSFNILSLLSLVMFPLTIANWIYSHRSCHYFYYQSADSTELFGAGTDPGVLAFWRCRSLTGPQPTWSGRFDHATFLPHQVALGQRQRAVLLELAGFAVYDGPKYGGDIDMVSFEIPDWFTVALTAALPLSWLWRYRRQRRRPGFCRKCAYDLTGNISGICPECGTPIPDRNAAASPGR